MEEFLERGEASRGGVCEAESRGVARGLREPSGQRVGDAGAAGGSNGRMSVDAQRPSA